MGDEGGLDLGCSSEKTAGGSLEVAIRASDVRAGERYFVDDVGGDEGSDGITVVSSTRLRLMGGSSS